MKRWRKKAKEAMMLIFGAEVMDTPKGWEQIEDRLMAEYAFTDFASAKQFVDAISQLSEEENHHPDISFGWGYCKIKIFTHAIKGLAESDFILAAKILIQTNMKQFH